jgi:predicted nucleic acid-binding protein
MPSKNYLLDTSSWISFITDEPETKKNTLKITNADQILVPFTVFEEIAALLHHRFSKEQARQSSIYLLNSSQTKVVTFNETELQAIVKTWNKLPLFIDFVDASLIWMQKQTNLPILTHDNHFKKLDCAVA